MKLIYPSKKYYNSYDEARLEYEKNNITDYYFDNVNEVDVEKKYKDYRKGRNLKPGYVPQTTYWLIDNDEFIGEIGIRHELNDNLINYGGHIGYGVRYSKWKQGYGTKMLAFALDKAKKMGLEYVLITCDLENIASAKVIENNGGKLDNVVENLRNGEKIKTKRYWIKL